MVKRYFLIVAILASLAGHLSGSPDQSSHASKRDVEEKPTSTTTVINNYESREPEHRPETQAPHWYASPEWVLVIVGVITFSVIGWQSWETRRAADATQVSAEATRRSADAIMTAERPWLVIRPESSALRVSSRFDWIIKNNGRTTAKILKCQLRARCMKAYTLESGLEPVPDYKSEIPVFGTIITPSDEARFWSYIETKDIEPDRMTEGLTDHDITEMLNGRLDLIAYGSVVYLDSFDNSQQHESRFCYYYAWALNEFRINLRAPAEYHQCT